MDTATLSVRTADGSGRLAGELFWWVDGLGRVRVGPVRVRMEGCLAAGRVCEDSLIGVVERVGARAAVLGILPRQIVDALAVRFPGVRWAVADVLPSATERPGDAAGSRRAA